MMVSGVVYVDCGIWEKTQCVVTVAAVSDT